MALRTLGARDVIPIGDDTPVRRDAVVTWGLIAACVVVFLWQISLGALSSERAILALGLVPALLTGHARLDPALVLVPPSLTVVTSMFMHGSWAHLIGNLLYLAIFGNNVEDRLGRLRFLLFYFACGAVAAACQVLPDPASRIPMVGASGAISGVLGAYFVLYPRANVVVFIPFSFLFIHRIQAVWMLGFWFLFQIINALLNYSATGGVAWYAHIGGFIAGLLLVWPLRAPASTRTRGPWG